ncbi:MAG: SidA/IucD/PvdA family monooxygenase [Myxococcota bacterium]
MTSDISRATETSSSPKSSSLDTDCLDIIAIGCGPFNLSLAALASTNERLRFLALDASHELRWHSGLMLDDATLQVGFLADLVSLVEPTHPLSFLAYLKSRDRMYPFYIRERFHVTRREYEDYLRWAVEQLDSIRYEHTVERVRWDEALGAFRLSVHTGSGQAVKFLAKHIAVGIGTEGSAPEAFSSLPNERMAHSSAYLHRLDDISRANRVTVVGSGQSGAEVVLDLIRRGKPGNPVLSWLTRTGSFAPLDYSKLVLEMTTPQYVRYFHGLPQNKRDALLKAQWQHFKAISTGTLEEIHEELYRRLVNYGETGVELRFGVGVESARMVANGAGPVVELDCYHRDTESSFSHHTDFVVTATGYAHRKPTFLEALDAELYRDTQSRYRIRLDHSIETSDAIGGRIFVANADLHSHGAAAPDLGLCAYRAGTIINTVSQRVVHELPHNTAFSSFGPPEISELAATRATEPQKTSHRSDQPRVAHPS